MNIFDEQEELEYELQFSTDWHEIEQILNQQRFPQFMEDEALDYEHWMIYEGLDDSRLDAILEVALT